MLQMKTAVPVLKPRGIPGKYKYKNYRHCAIGASSSRSENFLEKPNPENRGGDADLEPHYYYAPAVRGSWGHGILISDVNISPRDSSWAPGVFYCIHIFYNHAHRPRLEKLLFCI
jgi:hypothetical protein